MEVLAPRTKQWHIAMDQLERKLLSMTGSNRDYLLTNFEILASMDESDQEPVINLYRKFLKVNGMSEVLAWTAAVELSRMIARKYDPINVEFAQERAYGL